MSLKKDGGGFQMMKRVTSILRRGMREENRTRMKSSR
jgi:hypothetical protein